MTIMNNSNNAYFTLFVDNDSLPGSLINNYLCKSRHMPITKHNFRNNKEPLHLFIFSQMLVVINKYSIYIDSTVASEGILGNV
jgi:hypothetical protein